MYGMAGGMELQVFRAPNFEFGAWNLAKIALRFCGITGLSCKFQPLKTTFRTLANGHSIRHQSRPPLNAGRRQIIRNEALGLGAVGVLDLVSFSSLNWEKVNRGGGGFQTGGFSFFSERS